MISILLNLLRCVYIYSWVYTHIYTYIHVCVYVNTHILATLGIGKRKREREKEWIFLRNLKATIRRPEKFKMVLFTTKNSR